MIPVNKSFIPTPDFGILKLQVIQGATAAINVSAQVKIGREEIRLTLASDPLAAKWVVGMKAMMRTSGNANMRALEIVRIDHTNKYLFLKCPKEDVAGVIADTDIANVIQWGITPTEVYNAGKPLKNNEGQVTAIQYAVDGFFLVKKASKDHPVVFQMTNTDASTATTSGTVEFSLDKTNWHPCPSGLAVGALAAGESAMLIFEYNIVCWVRLNVDSNSTDYFVLGG